MTSVCRSCGQRIVWALTGSGKRMPVDAEPADNRNVLSRQDAEAARDSGEQLHVSHFATCPNAATHRKQAPA